MAAVRASRDADAPRRTEPLSPEVIFTNKQEFQTEALPAFRCRVGVRGGADILIREPDSRALADGTPACRRGAEGGSLPGGGFRVCASAATLGAGVSLTEDGTATYTVVLDTAPAASCTVQVRAESNNADRVWIYFCQTPCFYCLIFTVKRHPALRSRLQSPRQFKTVRWRGHFDLMLQRARFVRWLTRTLLADDAGACSR